MLKHGTHFGCDYGMRRTELQNCIKRKTKQFDKLSIVTIEGKIGYSMSNSMNGLTIQYTLDKCVFDVIAFIETMSTILTQRGFYLNYGLGRHSRNSFCNSILSWINLINDKRSVSGSSVGSNQTV